ncbi:hypothetical protein NE647_21525 [Blautia coccoides]|nr:MULTISPECIES: hypothetical protein [Blautia]MCB5876873.1 hypothetical protein [Blautia producta]MCB6782685.1 hypothetical protein [Blautia producta]MCQ4643005.1 hypothetical protein [Blautia coccoides]MCQ5124175.1 hypothetical protein [Blautia producta]
MARRGAGFGQAVKTLFHGEYEEVKALAGSIIPMVVIGDSNVAHNFLQRL